MHIIYNLQLHYAYAYNCTAPACIVLRNKLGHGSHSFTVHKLHRSIDIDSKCSEYDSELIKLRKFLIPNTYIHRLTGHSNDVLRILQVYKCMHT